MPISDQELETLHAAAEGPIKELLGELMTARKALPLARKLSQLGPLLSTSLFTMEMQERLPPEEVYLAILHQRPDRTGRVGPKWPMGEFNQDIQALAELLLTNDEHMDLKASMLVNMLEKP